MQAEVGGQVDDAHAALAQRGDDRRRGAVRVGDDAASTSRVAIGVVLLEHERHARARVHVVERARPASDARGDVRELEVRMAVQQRAATAPA